MTLLPIVERELRVAARRRGTYWTRAGIAMVATVLGVVTFLASLVIPTAKFGTLLFWGLAGMSMSYCLVAGRQMTADCLSEEKREGTFGLLFLTDLKGYDVVLGKLAARSFNGFYALMATVPILAIPLLVGGITWGEFWRMVVVLVDTFLFSLAIGIFASAVSRNYPDAMGRNFAIILLTMALPPSCAAALFAWHPTRPWCAELMFPCPIYAFALCADAKYRAGHLLFWSSAGTIHCLTWILILLACWLAPLSWQDKPAVPRPEARTRRRQWRWWREGSPEKRKAFRKKLLDRNAYYWLASRPYVKPAWVWTLLALTALWLARTALAVGRLEATVCIGGAVLLNSTLKLWIALESSQQLAADHKSGSFELLLSTPLTVEDILHGQLSALRRQFLKPLLAVIAMELVFVVLAVFPAYRFAMDASAPQLAWMWTAGIVMLAADAVTLSIMGMAAGMSAKNYTQASMRTVRYVLIVPWGLYGIAVLVLDLALEWRPDWVSFLSWKYQLPAWFCIGIFCDVLFGWTAWHRLRTQFRDLALRSFGPPPPGFFALLTRRIRSIAGAIWAQPHQAGQRSARKRLIIALAVGTAVLICVGFFIVSRASSGRFPKPETVQLGGASTKLRIISAREGLLFVLPDGSLWRWGRIDGLPGARAAAPERVGTDSDWVDASSGQNAMIGLRRDGTLWEWSFEKRSSQKPRQIDQAHDWVQISRGYNFSLALKRDGTLWGWGDNSWGQLGNGGGVLQTNIAQPAIWNGSVYVQSPFVASQPSTNLVQVGSDADWKEVRSQGLSVVALRQNGTLWTWGNIPVGRARSTMAYALPTQVCAETNWTGIERGSPTMARNRAGELWNVSSFFTTPASPNASAASVLYRVGVFPASTVPAFGSDGQFPTCYEIHADGTLWSTPMVWWTGANPVAQSWRRIGKRHDWISVWGNTRTIVGVTADGTISTWGADLSQEPSVHFKPRLQALGERVAGAFGSATAGNSSWVAYTIEKEPRPLMRLVPPSKEARN